MSHGHSSAPDTTRCPGTGTCSKDENDLITLHLQSQKLTIDQLIENEARKCWESFMEDESKQPLLYDNLPLQTTSKARNEQVSFDPCFKLHAFKSNSGLFHAVIKHGSLFDFLKNSTSLLWLENLNKSCELLRKAWCSILEDDIRKEISDHFEDILNLAKQLGNHVKSLIDKPSSPVFLTSNKSAILVFSKIQDEASKHSRYYVFVLADGAGPHSRFTLITAMKLRKNNFLKRIQVNGKAPKLWFDYYTGRIYFCSTEFLNDNGVYICLERNRGKSSCFEEFL